MTGKNFDRKNRATLNKSSKGIIRSVRDLIGGPDRKITEKEAKIAVRLLICYVSVLSAANRQTKS